jgi:phage tail-like protein
MADDPTYYPPGAFYFQLQFAGIRPGLDNAFQEATGLSVEWEVEEVREGGQNTFKHRLPTVARHSNLVLKRGFVSSQSDLATWCSATLSSNFTTPIVPRDVVLSLLGADGTPLAAWSFREAWPVKWSLSDFRSQENALAIETLEFAFSDLQKI